MGGYKVRTPAQRAICREATRKGGEDIVYGDREGQNGRAEDEQEARLEDRAEGGFVALGPEHSTSPRKNTLPDVLLKPKPLPRTPTRTASDGLKTV